MSKNFKLFIILITLSVFSNTGFSKDKKQWPSECKKVEIISSVDQNIQSAYFFQARSNQPRPLVVRLHAWKN